MLGEEDLNPQGFHNWIQPRRLATMMSPSIVTQNGKPIIIIGSGGSNRIRSAITQVLINFICNGMSIAQSIDAYLIAFGSLVIVSFSTLLFGMMIREPRS